MRKITVIGLCLIVAAALLALELRSGAEQRGKDRQCRRQNGRLLVGDLARAHFADHLRHFAVQPQRPPLRNPQQRELV